MTEDEAKTKACFRAATFGASQQLADGPGPNCLASACMAWQPTMRTETRDRRTGRPIEPGTIILRGDGPTGQRPRRWLLRPCWSDPMTKPQPSTSSKGESFTPGPWEVGRTGHIVSLVGRTVVAFTVSGGKLEHRPRESGANARLIASAPDLLEACKAAAFELTEATGINGMVRDRCLSALSKALGQEGVGENG